MRILIAHGDVWELALIASTVHELSGIRADEALTSEEAAKKLAVGLYRLCMIGNVTVYLPRIYRPHVFKFDELPSTEDLRDVLRYVQIC
jgi:hypothetical protein